MIDQKLELSPAGRLAASVSKFMEVGLSIELPINPPEGAGPDPPPPPPLELKPVPHEKAREHQPWQGGYAGCAQRRSPKHQGGSVL